VEVVIKEPNDECDHVCGEVVDVLFVTGLEEGDRNQDLEDRQSAAK